MAKARVTASFSVELGAHPGSFYLSLRTNETTVYARLGKDIVAVGVNGITTGATFAESAGRRTYYDCLKGLANTHAAAIKQDLASRGLAVTGTYVSLYRPFSRVIIGKA